MSKGNGLFLILLVSFVIAEMGDHSATPMVLILSNIWEFAIGFCGVWKMLELFNGWFKA